MIFRLIFHMIYIEHDSLAIQTLKLPKSSPWSIYAARKILLERNCRLRMENNHCGGHSSWSSCSPMAVQWLPYLKKNRLFASSWARSGYRSVPVRPSMHMQNSGQVGSKQVYLLMATKFACCNGRKKLRNFLVWEKMMFKYKNSSLFLHFFLLHLLFKRSFLIKIFL